MYLCDCKSSFITPVEALSGVWSAQSYQLRRFPQVSAVKQHFTAAFKSNVSKAGGEGHRPNVIFINKEPFVHIKYF